MLSILDRETEDLKQQTTKFYTLSFITCNLKKWINAELTLNSYRGYMLQYKTKQL